MSDLPEIDESPLSALLKVVSDQTRAILENLQVLYEDLWIGTADAFLPPNMDVTGREAAAAFFRLMDQIIRDSGVSEARFLTGHELLVGEPLPPEIASWAATQRRLYCYANGNEIDDDNVLAFVAAFRESVNEVVQTALPRLRFWAVIGGNQDSTD